MTPDLALLPHIPCDAKGPVFREPWEAHAFALAVSLNARGVFTWVEWAAALSAKITEAQRAGDADTGETYYHHWLAALEHLLIDKGVATPDAIATMTEAWHRAAALTPHGKPITLEALSGA
jgi:nitrile hydratase accessory protein